MRTQHARPKWELERAVRRAVLRERVLILVGGVLVALAFFATMLMIGLLG